MGAVPGATPLILEAVSQVIARATRINV